MPHFARKCLERFLFMPITTVFISLLEVVLLLAVVLQGRAL